MNFRFGLNLQCLQDRYEHLGFLHTLSLYLCSPQIVYSFSASPKPGGNERAVREAKSLKAPPSAKCLNSLLSHPRTRHDMFCWCLILELLGRERKPNRMHCFKSTLPWFLLPYQENRKQTNKQTTFSFTTFSLSRLAEKTSKGPDVFVGEGSSALRRKCFLHMLATETPALP